MNRIHREILQTNRVMLVKNLQFFPELLDYLESKQIIFENQRMQIMSKSSLHDIARVFIDIICRCGPKAYEEFKQALITTNQNHICEILIESEFKLNSEKCILKNIVPHCTNSIIQHNNLLESAQVKHILQPYKVTSIPRGFVLIINNIRFKNLSGVKNRQGSQKDVESLHQLFENFGYSVIIKTDLDYEQILNTLEKYVNKPEHKNVDACGLIIMTHGLMHHLYASDGQLVKLNDIISFFTNKSCPLLAGKPKFIIFQACRGDERDRGTVVSDGVNLQANNILKIDIDVPDHNFDPSSWISLPYMSDCVIAYSTFPGFVSWRSEQNGSWYIQILVEVFQKFGLQLHFLDLLSEVNRRLVEEGDIYGFKQISQPVNTLTKPFFLTSV